MNRCLDDDRNDESDNLSREKHDNDHISINENTSDLTCTSSSHAPLCEDHACNTNDISAERKIENDESNMSIVGRMRLNDHKAGMEGLDKVKINQVIHDASKGSKFYENERRKEMRTKERIEMIKIELTKYSELEKQKALLKSDEILNDLKNNIDMSRTLVHIDMDAYYASIEMRDNPKLKDVPMAVGGSSMLSTSNYLARKFGVRAAMPGFIAKKLCPQLVIVPCHFDKYRAVSEQIRDIFAKYDANFLPMSLDEAYLDLTEYIENNFYKYDTENKERDIAEIIVEEIRLKIFENTDLTASAGIGPNMMLSKICSDLNKPNGQYYLKPDILVINKFVRNLSIRKVFGIGKVSEQILEALNIKTCKDLYTYRNIIYLVFSESSFTYFMNVYLGISSNQIKHGKRKSLSVERTFKNANDKNELVKICHAICENLSSDLIKHELKGCNVALKYKLSNFVIKTRAKTIPYAVWKTEDIFLIAKDILLNEMKSFEPTKFELRLMGVRMSRFVDVETKLQHTVDKFLVVKNEQKQTDVDLASNGDKETTAVATNTDLVTCPVCGVLQPNDMTSLNQHIDNCLTKKTIRDLLHEQNNESSLDNLKRRATSVKRSRDNDNHERSYKKVTLHSFWNAS